MLVVILPLYKVFSRQYSQHRRISSNMGAGVHRMNIFIKKPLYFLFLSCFLYSQGVLADGLRFFGNGYSIDKRTSYSVFSEHIVTFSDNYEIHFELSLYVTSDIGNIVRIKDRDSNRVFNLFYDGHDKDHFFLLNEEGKSNLTSIALDKSTYPPREWLSVHIRFDHKNSTITLVIEDQSSQVRSTSLPNKFIPAIVFGKSDHIIDVPPFAIRNLSVGNSKTYRFLLDEHQGSIAHDTRGKEIGSVANPDWLVNDSYHWKPEAKFNSATVAGTNYHKGRKEFYYFNRDSLLILNLRTGDVRTILFNEPCPVDLRLGTNFIDQENDRLYSYEVYYDSTYQGPTIASLDLNSFEWQVESFDQLPTQLHHHGSWFDPSLRRYIIFGGFGNMRFSNHFYQYNIDTRAWSEFTVNNNESITPRYFTSLGHHEQKNLLYLFGGTGNVSGDQLLGREYFYDLYRLNLKTNTITKVWEIPWRKENVVPVRGMVINDNSFFYTLGYPEHFTESFLKLYRFSLKDEEYTILGDSIPIYSDRINTNANLYYDEDLNSLYAVVHQFEEDIQSEVNIYSLAFPPITGKELANHPPTGKKGNLWLVYALIGVILLSAGIVLLLWIRRKKKKLSVPVFDIGNNLKPKQIQKVRPNSIYLFGEFSVYGKDNRDITYMFSKKLKETFCLLVQYSQESGGITSQQLSRLLWPEKTLQNVKNIRNVTLSRLRKILGELEGVELLYEKGLFLINLESPVYCDYTRCMQILSTNPEENDYQELVTIVTRGKFLENEDNPFYDPMKENTERQVEPLIIHAMEESYAKEKWQATIDLAQAAFHIDPMNEVALYSMIRAMQKLGMHEEAKIKHLSFLIEYKRVMGKEYPNPMKL